MFFTSIRRSIVRPIYGFTCLSLLITFPGHAAEMDHSQHQTAPAVDHSQHMTQNDSEPFPSHSSHAGAWMFEYMYMRMFMNGMLDGSDDIDPKEVLQNPVYTKDPTEGDGSELLTNAGYAMTMDMHMFMAMYNQTSELTWMVMTSYLYNTMDMYDQMMPGGTPEDFPMESQGIGDVQLFAIYHFANTRWFNMSVTMGINFPTGTIDAPDGIEDMDTGEIGIAPYDMQMGSGTYDIHTALTAEKDGGAMTYGAKVYRISRTGFNVQDYNMGDRLTISGWLRYRFPFGTQVRSFIRQQISSKINGRDRRMTDNTNYTGGKRLDIGLGVGQSWRDFEIYADYNLPVLQYLNGVQMKTTGILSIGLMYMYM